MAKVCYMDLDGVLVDFVRGALAAHERSLPPDQVTWGFPAQIGFDGVNDSAFWDKLGFHFWANLSWTPEGKSLLAKTEELFGENVILMTSPCDTDGGVEGKVAWIRRELPNYRRRFFVGPPKHLAAGPGKLLLDDHDGNVALFREYGGDAILVPRPWNSRRAESDGQGGFSVDRLAEEVATWVG